MAVSGFGDVSHQVFLSTAKSNFLVVLAHNRHDIDLIGQLIVWCFPPMDNVLLLFRLRTAFECASRWVAKRWQVAGILRENCRLQFEIVSLMFTGHYSAAALLKIIYLLIFHLLCAVLGISLVILSCY